MSQYIVNTAKVFVKQSINKNLNLNGMGVKNFDTQDLKHFL